MNSFFYHLIIFFFYIINNEPDCRFRFWKFSDIFQYDGWFFVSYIICDHSFF